MPVHADLLAICARGGGPLRGPPRLLARRASAGALPPFQSGRVRPGPV